LFIDAISAYEEAIKLAPDVPYYKEAYEEFLLRHGLKK
jgi:cytochrome c-type biogenesis protein CcmH/NrfG